VACSTNLGIILLCAPTAVAFEALEATPQGGAIGPARSAAWRSAWAAVMAGLTRNDAEAAYRAIAMANPGGLGDAPDQDVRAAPTLDLRAAMALAADRDRIAAQYRDAGAELFDIGLATLDACSAGVRARLAAPPADSAQAVSAEASAAVQAVFLAFLASGPDSHIVRKHGSALAQSVMAQARQWRDKQRAGEVLEGQAAFIAWDEALKTAAINPGTSADLTVATLMLGALRD
jgi:triphosphoribosyl-dephospho-CoA synthase